MVQKTYQFNSIEELHEEASAICGTQEYKTAKDKVLLAWVQTWDRDGFALFKQEIFDSFHECTTIGTNHFGSSDILNGRTDGTSGEYGITLSFLYFEKAGASLLDIAPGTREEERQGRELRECLEKIPNVKGVYLIPPDYFCSTENILAALNGVVDIPVFGIKTSLLPEYQNFGFSAGGSLKGSRLFALIFHGEKLNIRIRYNLGWTPVGKIMTVTKEENPFFVDEIDDKPASDVYNRYLGLRNDQIIPENLSEFPLIIQRGDMEISRIGIAGPKDGQLLFGAPVYPGDKIRLSYGNPDDLLYEVIEDCIEIADFKPQAGLLIACSNRIMLLKEREREEIDYYRKFLCACAVVYGYAEIYYLNGQGGELNSALVSVAFREEDAENSSPCDMLRYFEDNEQKDSAIVPFSDRMSRFFKEMSNDLLMSAKEAEAANKAKSAFYSTVSHEIRTPLNSILGMNEMIRRESHEKEILDYAETISNSGKMLLALINDILDAEKIAAGKMQIVPVSYDIRKTIKELTDMVSVSAGSKGLVLKLEKDDDLPSVLIGDETRLRQCTLNLLNNAIKYTEKGTVYFKAGTEPVDNDHVKLTISVRDTGIGIKPEDIEKLSMPFERVDQSRNRNIEGTGLGLNIVKNLLELMGSSLEIKSTYGEGSEFSFSIIQELGRSSESSDSRNDNTAAGDGTGPFTAPDASVLIVDDTPSNIKIMSLLLKNSLINTDGAVNGKTAILLCEKKKYDLIFIDHMMPEMDGIETLRKIRSDPENINSGSVFVMLTANDEAGMKEMCIKEGFDDYMSKPIDVTQLDSILRKYLCK
ncbi:MAG: response regulator [Lachnospiraceae bacterium]|nr:response regulator [Lachnospiraceae bacterium]